MPVLELEPENVGETIPSFIVADATSLTISPTLVSQIGTYIVKVTRKDTSLQLADQTTQISIEVDVFEFFASFIPDLTVYLNSPESKFAFERFKVTKIDKYSLTYASAVVDEDDIDKQWPSDIIDFLPTTRSFVVRPLKVITMKLRVTGSLIY